MKRARVKIEPEEPEVEIQAAAATTALNRQQQEPTQPDADSKRAAAPIPESAINEAALLEIPSGKVPHLLFEAGCVVLHVAPSTPPAVVLGTVTSIWVDLSGDLSKKFVYRIKSGDKDLFARESELRWAPSCPVWARSGPVSQDEFSIPAIVLSSYETPSTATVHYSLQEIGGKSRIFHGLMPQDVRFRADEAPVAQLTFMAPFQAKRARLEGTSEGSGSATESDHRKEGWAPDTDEVSPHGDEQCSESSRRCGQTVREIRLPFMVDDRKIAAKISSSEKQKSLQKSLRCNVSLRTSEDGGRASIVVKGHGKYIDDAVEAIENSVVYIAKEQDRGRLLYHLAQANERVAPHKAVFQRVPWAMKSKMWINVYYFPKHFNRHTMDRFLGKAHAGLVTLRTSTRCNIVLGVEGATRSHLFIVGSNEQNVNDSIFSIRERWAWARGH